MDGYISNILIIAFLISATAFLYQFSLIRKSIIRLKNDAILRKFGTLKETPEVKAVMDFEKHDIKSGSYGPFKLGMTKDEFSIAMPSRVSFRNAPDDIAIGNGELIGYLMDYDIGPKFLLSPYSNGPFTLNQITSQRFFHKGELFAKKDLDLKN